MVWGVDGNSSSITDLVFMCIMFLLIDLFGIFFLKVIYDTFVSTPDLHEISCASGFWHEKNTVTVKDLELKTFQFRNKKQKCNPAFLLISLCAKSVCTDAFRCF